MINGRAPVAVVAAGRLPRRQKDQNARHLDDRGPIHLEGGSAHVHPELLGGIHIAYDRVPVTQGYARVVRSGAATAGTPSSGVATNARNSSLELRPRLRRLSRREVLSS